MDKVTNTSVNKIIDESISAYTDPVWSKENEALIEKLETAYKATPNKDLSNKNKQFYGIKFNNLHLLIDENTPSELLKNSSVYPIPLTTKWIIGVSNIRGDIIPIIDLESIINGTSKDLDVNNSNIIIINKGAEAIGLMLEQLPKIVSFTDDKKLNDYSDLPESIRDYINYAYEDDGTAWVGMNFPLFINSIKT